MQLFEIKNDSHCSFCLDSSIATMSLTRSRSAQGPTNLVFASQNDMTFADSSSLKDLLASFNLNANLSARVLYNLQRELDRQCLKLAVSNGGSHTSYEILEVGSVVELAVYLSGPLCHATHPGTFLFQELQLQALVSCLSLLHYHQVAALRFEQWDKLRHSDFRRIMFQLRSESSLPNRIRHASNPYLLQLASQYLSFIDRGDSKLPLIVGPIVKIFFGGVALVSWYNCKKPLIIT